MECYPDAKGGVGLTPRKGVPHPDVYETLMRNARRTTARAVSVILLTLV